MALVCLQPDQVRGSEQPPYGREVKRVENPPPPPTAIRVIKGPHLTFLFPLHISPHPVTIGPPSRSAPPGPCLTSLPATHANDEQKLALRSRALRAPLRLSPSRHLRAYSTLTTERIDPQLTLSPTPEFPGNRYPPPTWLVGPSDDTPLATRYDHLISYLNEHISLVPVRCMSTKSSIPCGALIFSRSTRPPHLLPFHHRHLPASSRFGLLCTYALCQIDLPYRVNILSMAREESEVLEANKVVSPSAFLRFPCLLRAPYN